MVQVIYTYAHIHVCVYVCIYIRLYMHSLYCITYSASVLLLLSSCRLPLDPSSVIHAGSWPWQLYWLVLLLSPMDKMLVMQQGPTEHVKANPEMKDDFWNTSFLSLFFFFKKKIKAYKLCSCRKGAYYFLRKEAKGGNMRKYRHSLRWCLQVMGWRTGKLYLLAWIVCCSYFTVFLFVSFFKRLA